MVSPVRGLKITFPIIKTLTRAALY